MNTSSLSDNELVTRILSGHPDLFGPLVERHIRATHAIAYARLGNASDAEDAVQEAFSLVAILVEIDECAGSGGRNVLFLDGHVEFRKGRLEEYADLSPFLNLR